jgi:hypothetical protein
VLRGDGKLGVELHFIACVQDAAGDFGADAWDALQFGFIRREDASGGFEAFQQTRAKDGAYVGGECEENLGAGVVVERRLRMSG